MILDSSTRNGKNAFLLSAMVGKIDQLQYFIDKKPEVRKSTDKGGRNAIKLATDHRDCLPTVIFLVTQGFKLSHEIMRECEDEEANQWIWDFSITYGFDQKNLTF